MRLILTRLIVTATTLLLATGVAACQSQPIVLDIMCGDTLELYTTSDSGSKPQRLTDFASQSAWAAHPYWSHNGRAIAFNVIFRDGDRHRSELYAISPNGSDLRPLTRTPNGKSSWSVAWAPDGARIAFVSDRDGPPDIYAMRIDRTGVERLTVSTGDRRHAWNPDWSPDGRQIAFNANWNGNDEIYLLDVATRRVRPIGSTPPGKDSWTPAWSPDGSQIAFGSNRDGEDELYVMSTDGSNIRPTHTRATGRPRWSPDGKMLIFQRFATANREEVWTVNVDGSAARSFVSHNRCSVRHPDWQRLQQ